MHWLDLHMTCLFYESLMCQSISQVKHLARFRMRDPHDIDLPLTGRSVESVLHLMLADCQCCSASTELELFRVLFHILGLSVSSQHTHTHVGTVLRLASITYKHKHVGMWGTFFLKS